MEVETGLSRCGFSVTCVESGLGALNTARRALPEVILLDELLPDLEGPCVCSILQVQPSTRHAQVGLFVRRNQSVTWGNSSSPGYPLFVEKPVSIAALTEVVVRLARRYRERALSAILELNDLPEVVC